MIVNKVKQNQSTKQGLKFIKEGAAIMSKKSAITIGCTIVASTLGMQSVSSAAIDVLSDKDSQLQVNTGVVNTGAYSNANPRSGVFHFQRQVSGGQNGDQLLDLVQQTYFIRFNNGNNTEINALNLVGAIAQNNDSDAGNETLFVRYTDAANNAQVDLIYTLVGSQGGGSFTNQLKTQVVIKNKSVNSNLTGSLISYHNMKLTGFAQPSANNGGTGPWVAPGDPYNQEAEQEEFAQIKTVNGATRARQTGITPSNGLITESISDSISSGPTGRPDKVETRQGGSLLTTLAAGGQYNLADGNGALNQSFSGLSSAAGDLEYAFQWNFNIAKGGVFGVTEKTVVTPEPASLVLLGVGTAMVVFPGRHSRKRSK